jgi:hypothetical protein
LWRDGIGSNPAYPFALGSLGAHHQQQCEREQTPPPLYYFFYDWEVEAPATVAKVPARR